VLAGGRRYEEAIQSTRQMLRLAPGRTKAMASIAHYLTLLGRYDEAAKAMQQTSEITPIQQVYRANLAIHTGDKAKAERLIAGFRTSDYAQYQVAQVLAQLGRKDEAIAALEIAWRGRDSGLTSILVDPLLDPLRDNPRFEAIVKRIDFPA